MWQTDQNQLYKKFTFKDFREAFGFLEQVAQLANEMEHHPRIHNNWNVVELWLVSHDAGDTITDKDRRLAEKIDALPAPGKTDENT